MVRFPLIALAFAAVTTAHAADGVTYQIEPTDVGTVRYSPSIGVQDYGDDIIVSCDVLAPGDVEYRRGIMEFDLGSLVSDVASATLRLTEGGSYSTLEVPPDSYDLSY